MVRAVFRRRFSYLRLRFVPIIGRDGGHSLVGSETGCLGE